MNTPSRPTLPSTNAPITVELLCHPATPSAAHFRVACQLSVDTHSQGLALHLDYEVTGDVHRLRLPHPTPAGLADRLWEHTCFEAFFADPSTSAYRELNFSPSTQWAHYRFASERVRDTGWVASAAPQIQTPALGADRLTFAASIAGAPLPPGQAPLFCSISAVLELTDGSLSYWAVHHPAAKPDFHARAGWTVPQPWCIG